LKIKEDFLFSHFYLPAGIIKRGEPFIFTCSDSGEIQ